MNEPLWFALRCPHLPLEALFTDADRHGPLAVAEGRRIVMANEPARQAGICAGMHSATAHGCCPGLRTLLADPAAQRQALYQLAEHMLRITPAVSLQGGDGLVLEAGGCLRLFAGIEGLRSALFRELEQVPLTLRTGAGPTPESARQFTALPPEQSLALFPAGRLDRQAFRHLLEAMPLTSLELDPGLRRRVLRPGFTTLGELLALPRSALGRRFGRKLLHWLERLLGERPDPRTPLRPRQRFYRQREFSEPVAHTEGLLYPMEGLLEELAEFLRQRQQYSRAIRWRFRGLQETAQTLLIRRATPGGDAHRWMLLTRRHLEDFRLTTPVLQLSLECAPGRPASGESGDLLAAPRARPGIDSLMEELAGLPEVQCLPPTEPEGHLPELQTREPSRGQTLPHRPLWLCDPPRALTQHEGRPCWRGAPLELLPGEERITGEWWQHYTHRRYFRARHPRGWYCWVFRENGRWWLHGIF